MGREDVEADTVWPSLPVELSEVGSAVEVAEGDSSSMEFEEELVGRADEDSDVELD